MQVAERRDGSKLAGITCDLIGAELYLSDVLGIKVDLVPRRSLREELRETILEEAIVL